MLKWKKTLPVMISSFLDDISFRFGAWIELYLAGF